MFLNFIFRFVFLDMLFQSSTEQKADFNAFESSSVFVRVSLYNRTFSSLQVILKVPRMTRQIVLNLKLYFSCFWMIFVNFFSVYFISLFRLIRHANSHSYKIELIGLFFAGIIFRQKAHFIEVSLSEQVVMEIFHKITKTFVSKFNIGLLLFPIF